MSVTARAALALTLLFGGCVGAGDVSDIPDVTDKGITDAPAPAPAPGPTPAPASPGPSDGEAAAKVVRTWIEGGAAGDETAVKAALVERCHGTEALSVPPVHVLGVRVVIDELVVAAPPVTGDHIEVGYEIKGQVPSVEHEEKTTFLGIKLEMKAKTATFDHWATSGTVPVEKVGGTWKVSCP